MTVIAMTSNPVLTGSVPTHVPDGANDNTVCYVIDHKPHCANENDLNESKLNKYIYYD